MWVHDGCATCVVAWRSSSTGCVGVSTPGPDYLIIIIHECMWMSPQSPHALVPASSGGTTHHLSASGHGQGARALWRLRLGRARSYTAQMGACKACGMLECQRPLLDIKLGLHLAASALHSRSIGVTLTILGTSTAARGWRACTHVLSCAMCSLRLATLALTRLHNESHHGHGSRQQQTACTL